MNVVPRILAAAGALAASVALAGCGSGSTTLSTASRAAGTNPAATTSPAASSGGMSGMQMGSGKAATSSTSAAGAAVDGIKPIPTQTLATADWQDLKITARAMTPVPFVIFNGTSERTVKVPKRTSFHLMVTLDDARTGYPIPYAGVWATIRRAGKIVFDERQWPMLSEYMGPHYGNNVTLPGPGTYSLTLLISPPVAARHMEYKNVWTVPHRVTETFTWSGT